LGKTPVQASGGRRPAIDPAALRLPAGMNFSCHFSGRCCQDFWEIPLDEVSADRLKTLPMGSISPKFMDPARYTEPSACRPHGLAMRRHEGACVFMDGNRRCVIHGNFGAEAKPQTCQDFPFRYVRTPRGIFVGVSMACVSARANRGRPLEEMRAELAENYRRSLNVRSIGEAVELGDGVPVRFQEYEQIEACLGELFALETRTLDDRLIAGFALIQMLERAVQEAPGRLSEMLALFRRDQFQRVVSIAGKGRGSDRLHRAIVGLLLKYRSAFDARPRGRMGRTAYLLFQYLRNIGGLGPFAMPPLEGRFWPARLRAIRADWTDPYFTYLVRRFCEHSLFRKDAIVATPLVKGYGFLLLYVALIRWYARAFAATRNVGEVGRNDVEEALSAVEKYFCLHSNFMQLFERYPVFSWMIDRQIAAPHFAPTMVRPKGP
jgi:Fe-S-cluster containining protein